MSPKAPFYSGPFENRSPNLFIESKPRPEYTSEARENGESGSVILRVTFLSNGQIGAIQPVKTLDFGLTDQAIKVAKRIKFQPAKKDGVPVTVTRQIEYSFSIY